MNTCPVCGYPALREPPHAPSGGGSYEICPSCGFQFGVDDDDKGITYAVARERWVAAGCTWQSRGVRAPVKWDPATQLQGLLKPDRSKVKKVRPSPGKD